MRYFGEEVQGLLAHLRRTAPDGESRRQVLDDLLDRISTWELDDQLLVLANIGLAYLPPSTYERYPEARYRIVVPPEMSTRTPTEVDVVAIAVKKPELYAVQMAFGIDPSRPPDDKHRGVRFWEGDCESARDTKMSFVVCMAGEDGNTRMASFMSTVFQRYTPQLCVLLGMAAGVPGEVELGDVVAAEMVIDPSKVRVTETASYPRSDYESPSHHRALYRDQMHFDPRKYGWSASIAEVLPAATACEFVDLPDRSSSAEFSPRFHTGVVIGGSVLVEDGSLRRVQQEVHDRTRSQEMEGYGFAHACEEAEIKWLLWRGIADAGEPDPSTGERPKDWQFLATLACAVAMRLFFKHDYGAETDLSE